MKAADPEPSPFATTISRIREMRESSAWPARVPELAAEERAFRVATAREAVRPKLSLRSTGTDISPEAPPVRWSREVLHPFVAPFVILAAGSLLVGVIWKLLEIKSVYRFVTKLFGE